MHHIQNIWITKWQKLKKENIPNSEAKSGKNRIRKLWSSLDVMDKKRSWKVWLSLDEMVKKRFGLNHFVHIRIIRFFLHAFF